MQEWEVHDAVQEYQHDSKALQVPEARAYVEICVNLPASMLNTLDALAQVENLIRSP
jgi:hypothetical protein